MNAASASGSAVPNDSYSTASSRLGFSEATFHAPHPGKPAGPPSTPAPAERSSAGTQTAAGGWAAGLRFSHALHMDSDEEKSRGEGRGGGGRVCGQASSISTSSAQPQPSQVHIPGGNVAFWIQET